MEICVTERQIHYDLVFICYIAIVNSSLCFFFFSSMQQLEDNDFLFTLKMMKETVYLIIIGELSLHDNQGN